MSKKVVLNWRWAMIALALLTAVTTASFFTLQAANAQEPGVKKLKVTGKNSKAQVKMQKAQSTTLKAQSQKYTLKTNTKPAPAKTLTETTFTEYEVATGANISSITKGTDGSSFWFTEYSRNRIGKITTQGAITEYNLPNADWWPQEITTGPDGVLWFTYRNRTSPPSYIGSLTPNGQATLYNIASSVGIPKAITKGSDNALWFTTDNSRIGRITTSGDITVYPLNTSVTDISSGPDGAIWFSNNNTIGRLTANGNYTLYTSPTLSTLTDITEGRNSDLWFTDRGTNVIGRITTGGDITSYPLSGNYNPSAITHLGNGTFAFGTDISGTEATNYMGRITPAGDIELFPIPDESNSVKDMIYAGWANEVWFTTDSQIYKFRVVL